MARKKNGRDIDGIVVVNKPLGLSSNQVLQRVKTLFNANKAGHTGALDPQATGLLPICLGEATKFSQVLLESDKTYETTATLGEVRSSGDSEGDIVRTLPVPPLTPTLIEDVLAKFRGDVEQVPPMFSALKMDGKPLYKLARKGMTTEEMRAIAEKKRRTIRIHDLHLNDATDSTLELSVKCSKGTYIRTLIEDIGDAIGCGAYVSRLHRTQSGPYDSSMMYTLAELEALAEESVAALDGVLLSLETAIPESFPTLELTWDEARYIIWGQSINTGLNDTPSVQLWAVESGVRELIGIGRIENHRLKARRLMHASQAAIGNVHSD